MFHPKSIGQIAKKKYKPKAHRNKIPPHINVFGIIPDLYGFGNASESEQTKHNHREFGRDHKFQI